MFPAFQKDPNAPKSNLAEVIHSSWESRKQRNLTLHDAAAFDVKESFQLDLEIEEFEKGTFRGGTGPSAAKRASCAQRNTLERVDRIAKEIFELSDKLPNPDAKKLPNVNVTDSHRADKSRKASETRATKFRSSKNRQIQCRIKTAREQESQIKVKEFSDADYGRVYKIVGSTWLQKEPYEVVISETPNCSCPDFLKNHDSGPCKHLIWLYIFVFHLPETSNIIQQTSLTVGELTDLLKVYEVQEQYIARKCPPSRYEECKQLLSGDPRSTQAQTWRLHKKKKKPGKTPSCPTCKEPIENDSLCISVRGLYVPFDQSFVQEKDFYFCADAKCLEKLPFYTNLSKPKSIKAESVTRAEINSTGLSKAGFDVK